MIGGDKMEGQEWMKDKEKRMDILENISDFTNVFVGTMMEYKQALFEGKIKNGMLVTITKLN